MGSIPMQLGNLINLGTCFWFMSVNVQIHFIKLSHRFLATVEVLDLSSTQLSGIVPTEVCDIVANHNLTEFIVDCLEVECECCSECS